MAAGAFIVAPRAPRRRRKRERPSVAEEPADYRRLGETLGLRPNTVAVAVHRLRARLRELVREELADQSDGPLAVEQELRAMRSALLAPGPGPGSPP